MGGSGGLGIHRLEVGGVAVDYFTQAINERHEEANRCFCPECKIRVTPFPTGWTTCGGSYCQEASFYRNRARTARKRDKAHWEALADATAALGLPWWSPEPVESVTQK